MEKFFTACRAANEAIAEAIAGGLDASLRTSSQIGAGGDVSAGIDLKAEAIFVDYLAPFGRIESEESGTIGSGEFTIILDPIDGSSNILSDFPYYGTSAALVDPDGITVAGCVCNLANGDIFFKSAGKTAQKGKLFSEERYDYLRRTDGKIGLFERAYSRPDLVEALGKADLKFRAPGAVALSLVYALQTRFFLYAGSYRHYDFAAGLLFCEGLEVEAKEDYVIVSHDKILQGQLENIVHKARSHG